MRRIAIVSLLLVGLTPLAQGQVLKGPVNAPKPSSSTGTTPLRGNGGKPTKSIATAATKNKDATLTITYPALQLSGMWATSPSGNFKCAQPVFGVIMMYGCTLTVPAGTVLPVKAVWSANAAVVGSRMQVGGAMWGGACAGTAGDTCTITMNDDMVASVDPKQPGGAPIPIGQSSEP